MSIQLALLLSLALHVILVFAPEWQAAKLQVPPIPAIEARLMVLPDRVEMAEAVSSMAPDALPPVQSPAPTSMRGRSLHRTREAFSEHLFYPPEAAASGIEGEVILLLTLAADGRLTNAEIARSSGHAVLDQAALDAARRVGRLPGNPRQTLFPVSFRLR